MSRIFSHQLRLIFPRATICTMHHPPLTARLDSAQPKKKQRVEEHQPQRVEEPPAPQPVSRSNVKVPGSKVSEKAAASRSKESTRQKNSRKQKAGQANFSLKWDRDCGAELAGT